MSEVVRITSDGKLKATSFNVVVGIPYFDELGNVYAEEFCTMEPYYDADAMSDEELVLDEEYILNEEDGIETLFNYLFNISSTDESINQVSIHNNNKILANEFVVGI